MMTEQEYLSERLDDQLAYYDRQSQKNQRAYKRTKLIKIVAASLIPLLAGSMGAVPFIEWVVGALGLLIAVCEGLSSLHKYQENWLQYRATAEALTKERFLFLTKSKPYTDNRAYHILVQRIEGLLAEENNQWAETMQPDAQSQAANEATP